MTVSGLFDGLLDDRVGLAVGTISQSRSVVLSDVEEHAIVNAVEKRRREFATGRLLARQALAQFGYQGSAIPAGPDRAPIWPDGIVGSISHTHTVCAATVALKASGVASIGIDVEDAAPLDAELWDTVMARAEQERLPAAADMARGLMEKVVFSAKEAAYKCQYPISGELLDFLDFAVSLDADLTTFSARFSRDVRPFAAGDELLGRWRIADDHIATAVILNAADVPG